MLFSETLNIHSDHSENFHFFIPHDHSLQVYPVGRWSYWELKAKLKGLWEHSLSLSLAARWGPKVTLTFRSDFGFRDCNCTDFRGLPKMPPAFFVL